MPRKRKAEPAQTGKRVGIKKSDRRWQDASGQIWASKLESDLFDWLGKNGAHVRKCDQRDSVSYATSVRSGVCGECGSGDVRQAHTYTPDLCVGDCPSFAQESGNLLEAKGYLRPEDRRVLRGVLKAQPSINLCLVLQRYHKPTIDWARRFLKIPVFIFDKHGLAEAQ